MRALAVFVGLLVSGSATAAVSEFALDLARLSRAPVAYRELSQRNGFPVPVISVRRPGLSAGSAELAEIKEKVLYPLIMRSKRPISAMVLEWFPAMPEQLGVSVIWSNGEERGATLGRTSQGRYDEKAYEVFFAKPTP